MSSSGRSVSWKEATSDALLALLDVVMFGTYAVAILILAVNRPAFVWIPVIGLGMRVIFLATQVYRWLVLSKRHGRIIQNHWPQHAVGFVFCGLYILIGIYSAFLARSTLIG